MLKLNSAEYKNTKCRDTDSDFLYNCLLQRYENCILY